MKQKACDLYLIDFTSDEHEVTETLVLLQTLVQKDNEIKLKITFGEKPICERNIVNINDIRPMLQNNILNVAIENEYNPPDIPNIHGIPNNNIVCCKPFEKNYHRVI